MAVRYHEVVGGTLKFRGDVDFTETSTFVGGNISGVTALQLTTGATNGYVLKTNALGNASWSPNNSLIAGSDLVAIDNVAAGLKIIDDSIGDPQTYLTFDTQNTNPRVVLGQKLAAGTHEVSGSNFAVTGGTLSGITAFQFTATPTNGYYLKTDASGNASWAPVATAQGADNLLQVSNGSGELKVPGVTVSAGNAKIANVGTPTLGTDAATKQYVDDNTLDVSGSSGFVQLNNGSGNLGSDSLLYWDSGTDTLHAQNLTVAGTQTINNTSNLSTSDVIIITNNGETGAGVTAGQSGMEVERGTETNFRYVFDEPTDTFRIGLIGSLQAVATREDAPTDGGVATWNDTAKRYDATLTPTVTTLTTTNFTMNNGAINGYVLTTNGSGVATWQANPGAVPGSDIVAVANQAQGLQIVDNAGIPNVYITFDTTTGSQQIEFEQPITAGANQVSGSNFQITGGSVTGLSALQLDTATAAGYLMTSDALGNASWVAKPTLQETYTGSTNGNVTLDNTRKGVQIRDNATPITGSDLFSVTNSTAATTYFKVSPTTTEVAAFKLAAGAGAGKVLISDASGNGTWGTSTSSGWADDGSVVRLTNAGDAVSIGSATLAGVEKLRVLDGGVLFDGVSGAVPTSGAGTRFMWAGAKAALRAGAVDGAQWDDANVGSWSVAFGGNTTASASYSTALGSGTEATSSYSVASGRYSKTRLLGQHAQATAKFVNTGDAQTSVFVMSRQTTSNTPLDLTLDGGVPGASNRLTLADNTSYHLRMDIIARCLTVDDETGAWEISMAADRNVGVATTALVGTPFLQTVSKDVSAWAVAVSADITNGALKVTVTGEAAKTINWVARVTMTEVSA